ncbi:DUF6214 family protein [Streptomyces sp. NPDC088785]|uniref:DUF6214 family protein n=1 Tax=Streptomyces sp. NPDC088785 TaxID=3365897 RepID=UPI0037F3DB90
MLESSFFDVADHYRLNDAVPAEPRWEIQGHGSVAGALRDDVARSCPSPWFQVRLTLDRGTRIDVLAVLADGRISIEDVRAQPPLSAAEFASLAPWWEGPLQEACRSVADPHDLTAPAPAPAAASPEAGESGARRARAALPRGVEGRRAVAETYRAAQSEGGDPVLAVMCATGRSRRKSLRLIAGARDAGLLTPRHHRR